MYIGSLRERESKGQVMAAGVKPKVGFVCGVKGVATQVKLWSSETWGQGLGLRVYVFFI